MRRILDTEGIRLTKSLGQNFLHDGNQLRRIVDAARLSPNDQVLEIGPGLGPLTELLLPRVKRLVAIEKDRRLASWLGKRFAGVPQLQLTPGDALEILQTVASDWTDWKLVANLPYSVASPIIVEMAGGSHPPRAMIVTLQWEVVRRLIACAGDPDYGLLTVFVQLRYEPVATFKVPRGCFYPAPDVDSGCISLVRRQPTLAPAPQLLRARELARIAFSQRRKMMCKLLVKHFEAGLVAVAMDAASLAPTVRAEQVSPAQYVRLAAELHNPCNP